MRLFRLIALVAAMLITTLAAGASADVDFDGVSDAEDNCVEVPNPSQEDSDGDGFGNHCDADFDNNCAVEGLDFMILAQCFDMPGVAARNVCRITDLNDDHLINSFDFEIFEVLFEGVPGPSGTTICP